VPLTRDYITTFDTAAVAGQKSSVLSQGS